MPGESEVIEIPVSEARKRANYTWDAKNMTNLACRVTKEKAKKFREACKAAGTNSNAVLLATVDKFIAEHEDSPEE